MAISEREMLVTLSDLYHFQLDYIVDQAGIAPGVIPANLPTEKRAKALVDYFLDAYNSLRGLYELAYQVSPLYVMRD